MRRRWLSAKHRPECRDSQVREENKALAAAAPAFNILQQGL